MRTISPRILIAATLLGACAQFASAQTADEIVEKQLAAMGGREALGKVVSRSSVGTITLSTPVGDVSGTVEVLNAQPNKQRTLMKLDLSALGAGQALFDQRFDGNSAYVIDSVQGNREITGDLLETMKNGGFPTPLLTYKEKGATLTLQGKEKVGERDAYVLVFTPKTGPPARQYVDAETYLPIKTVVTVDVAPVGAIEQTVETLDHRDVGGVKVPFRLHAFSSAQTYTVTFTNVEQNVPVDDTVFSKPQ